MFNDICFYVKGNMIKVNGQDFLLGELSASCMNIPPSEFEEIYDKYRSAEYIMNHEINAEKDNSVEYIPPLKGVGQAEQHDGRNRYGFEKT